MLLAILDTLAIDSTALPWCHQNERNHQPRHDETTAFSNESVHAPKTTVLSRVWELFRIIQSFIGTAG